MELCTKETTPLLSGSKLDFIQYDSTVIAGNELGNPLAASSTPLITTTYSPLLTRETNGVNYQSIQATQPELPTLGVITTTGAQYLTPFWFGRIIKTEAPVHPRERLQLQQVVDYLQSPEAKRRGNHNISSRWFSYWSSERLYPYEPTYSGQFKQVFLGSSQAALLKRFITLLNHHFGELYTSHNIIDPTQREIIDTSSGLYQEWLGIMSRHSGAEAIEEVKVHDISVKTALVASANENSFWTSYIRSFIGQMVGVDLTIPVAISNTQGALSNKISTQLLQDWLQKGEMGLKQYKEALQRMIGESQSLSTFMERIFPDSYASALRKRIPTNQDTPSLITRKTLVNTIEKAQKICTNIEATLKILEPLKLHHSSVTEQLNQKTASFTKALETSLQLFLGTLSIKEGLSHIPEEVKRRVETKLSGLRESSQEPFELIATVPILADELHSIINQKVIDSRAEIEIFDRMNQKYQALKLTINSPKKPEESSFPPDSLSSAFQKTSLAYHELETTIQTTHDHLIEIISSNEEILRKIDCLLKPTVDLREETTPSTLFPQDEAVKKQAEIYKSTQVLARKVQEKRAQLNQSQKELLQQLSESIAKKTEGVEASAQKVFETLSWIKESLESMWGKSNGRDDIPENSKDPLIFITHEDANNQGTPNSTNYTARINRSSKKGIVKYGKLFRPPQNGKNPLNPRALTLIDIVQYLQNQEAHNIEDHNIASRFIPGFTKEKLIPYEETYGWQFSQAFSGGSQLQLLHSLLSVLHQHFGFLRTHKMIIDEEEATLIEEYSGLANEVVGLIARGATHECLVPFNNRTYMIGAELHSTGLPEATVSIPISDNFETLLQNTLGRINIEVKIKRSKRPLGHKLSTTLLRNWLRKGEAGLQRYPIILETFSTTFRNLINVVNGLFPEKFARDGTFQRIGEDVEKARERLATILIRTGELQKKVGTTLEQLSPLKLNPESFKEEQQAAVTKFTEELKSSLETFIDSFQEKEKLKNFPEEIRAFVDTEFSKVLGSSQGEFELIDEISPIEAKLEEIRVATTHHSFEEQIQFEQYFNQYAATNTPEKEASRTSAVFPDSLTETFQRTQDAYLSFVDYRKNSLTLVSHIIDSQEKALKQLENLLAPYYYLETETEDPLQEANKSLKEATGKINSFVAEGREQVTNLKNVKMELLKQLNDYSQTQKTKNRRSLVEESFIETLENLQSSLRELWKTS